MAKKDKKGSEGSVANREIYQRMNFLYQAAMCMATITDPHRKPPKAVKTKSTSDSTSGTEANISTPHEANGVPSEATSTVSTTVDVQMEGDDTHLTKTVSSSSSHSHEGKQSVGKNKLSRKQRKEQLRQHKVRIAKEQISPDLAHHTLENQCRHKARKQQQHHQTDGSHPYHLTGTARFYASTLREIGRKSVIRIDPSIKRSICLRCEAVLIPYVSAEVRVEAEPQLNTMVICKSCGAFRRYFCMAGKGIEGDRIELEDKGSSSKNVIVPGTTLISEASEVSEVSEALGASETNSLAQTMEVDEPEMSTHPAE